MYLGIFWGKNPIMGYTATSRRDEQIQALGAYIHEHIL